MRYAQRKPYSEFLKELLGAVFPGAFLLFSLVFIFFGPVLLLDIIYLNSTEKLITTDQFLTFTIKNYDFFSTISMLVLFLIFSFVFGTIYYRRTCDVPNQYSIYKNLTKDYVFLSLINKKHRIYSRKYLRWRVCNFINKHRYRVRILESYIREKYAINGLNAIGIIKVKKILLHRNIVKILRHPILYFFSRKYLYLNTNYCNSNCQINNEFKISEKNSKSIFRYDERYQLGKKRINISYPFSCIEKYLRSNGYLKLAKNIKCPSIKLKRNYINEIKLDFSKEIMALTELEKIEAHIRYSSSMWYVAKSITKLSYIMLGIFSFLALVIIRIKTLNGILSTSIEKNLLLCSFLAVMFIGCYFVNFRIYNYIENYLHKQRLTEMLIALNISKKK
jgi:hypothetical protein